MSGAVEKRQMHWLRSGKVDEKEEKWKESKVKSSCSASYEAVAGSEETF